jgi:L-seryl-tRNA(Ser) seleniumtransferase
MQRNKEKTGKLLRKLPAVSRLLAARPVKALVRRHGAELVTALLRDTLEERRKELRAGRLAGKALEKAITATAIAADVGQAAAQLLAPRPRAVINATGVVVHTNLGRSLLSEEAALSVAAAAGSYVDLEYDLEGGGRGSRLSQLEPLMARLFPDYSFIAVNNNAAALMLCLRALGRRREVLVSRGELVEIGGSFRLPDIMAASGAKLLEVGTTNRTRLGDYRCAISPRTSMILKVHTSNFKIVGFTEEAPIFDLAALAREKSLPLVVDWGSGDLVELEPLGIRDEVPALEVLKAGADLVTFSGDKLLGGPQAGFVVGDPDLIAKLRSDPLARVCRLDRLLIAAMARTLSAYVRGRQFEEIPTLRMLKLSKAAIALRAGKLKKKVASLTGMGKMLSLADGASRTGGGSSPMGQRPTKLLAVKLQKGDAAPLERRLRECEPPVIARMQEGRLLLDLRTVLPEQDGLLAELLAGALLRR